MKTLNPTSSGTSEGTRLFRPFLLLGFTSQLLHAFTGRRFRKFDAPHNLLPATLKNSGKPLDDLDGKVGLSMFAFHGTQLARNTPLEYAL
jgi:hypothetical protein